ncbi:hypothetical protein DH2020_029975 [Rehmannia glutinosa]|uniref:Uncharacterized protein n=1 Tax=Rehmannia glutinosa TaxID=99300 RepID=A0ABR0VPL8_REHGL
MKPLANEFDLAKVKEMAARERKEETNRKIASQKAISIILRREATKAVIEKKKGNNSKKLLPRTVLEALHERITALRWESSLKAYTVFRGQSFGSLSPPPANTLPPALSSTPPSLSPKFVAKLYEDTLIIRCKSDFEAESPNFRSARETN